MRAVFSEPRQPWYERGSLLQKVLFKLVLTQCSHSDLAALYRAAWSWLHLPQNAIPLAVSNLIGSPL